jgi:hypothetical protein
VALTSASRPCSVVASEPTRSASAITVGKHVGNHLAFGGASRPIVSSTAMRSSAARRTAPACGPARTWEGEPERHGLDALSDGTTGVSEPGAPSGGSVPRWKSRRQRDPVEPEPARVREDAEEDERTGNANHMKWGE